jgi:hypothetical protein
MVASRLVTEADVLISHAGEVLPVFRFQQAELSEYFGQDSDRSAAYLAVAPAALTVAATNDNKTLIFI